MLIHLTYYYIQETKNQIKTTFLSEYIESSNLRLIRNCSKLSLHIYFFQFDIIKKK